MKIKTSAFVDDMNGSSAGSNAYRDRTGLHLRTKSGRIKSTSPKLQNSQQKFRNVIDSWPLLKDRQMVAWNDLARTFFKKDKIGNVFPYCGRDIFEKFSRNLLEIGEEIKLDPPNSRNVQTFKSFSVELIQEDYLLKDIILNIRPKISKDTKILIYATNPSKPGRYFINPNRYKKIGYIDSSFISGHSILHLYNSVFFEPRALSFRMGFFIKPVNRNSGITGKEIFCRASSDD